MKKSNAQKVNDLAGKDNLKVPTSEEAREYGRRGGKASVESRRKKKALREAFDALLEREWSGKGGDTLSGTDALALRVFEKAMKGDLRAFEIIRDTTGQRPQEQVFVEYSEGNSELAELIESLKDGDSDESRE